MKTISTKLDKRDFEKFQEMCNNDGQCMSESLRELIKLGIDAYEDGLEIESKQIESKQIESKQIESKQIESKQIESKQIESKQIESTSNSPRPEMKNVRISYDGGKTWN